MREILLVSGHIRIYADLGILFDVSIISGPLISVEALVAERIVETLYIDILCDSGANKCGTVVVNLSVTLAGILNMA